MPWRRVVGLTPSNSPPFSIRSCTRSRKADQLRSGVAFHNSCARRNGTYCMLPFSSLESHIFHRCYQGYVLLLQNVTGHQLHKYTVRFKEAEIIRDKLLVKTVVMSYNTVASSV